MKAAYFWYDKFENDEFESEKFIFAHKLGSVALLSHNTLKCKITHHFQTCHTKNAQPMYATTILGVRYLLLFTFSNSKLFVYYFL